MDLSIRQTSRASKPYDPIHHIPFHSLTPFIHFLQLLTFTMHNVLVAASALLLAHCGASPIAALKVRQSSCPEVHVFGARETTAPAGYGTASVVVDLVLGAYAGATSEAIDYPAWYGASAIFRVTLYCN